MIALTTRQRDLLQTLLVAQKPMTTAELATKMNLTSRQINYGLKGVNNWLLQYEQSLNIKPGIGVILDCSPSKRENLIGILHSEASFQLILSASQRQQLIILKLLIIAKPSNLTLLQRLVDASRTTILKDLDSVTEWLALYDLQVERRPNYGIWIENGSELAYRKALTALLWGDAAFFEEPLWKMDFNGLHFHLKNDAYLMNTLTMVHGFCEQIQTKAGMAHVAYAEADLGGRFTDNAVLSLALIIAVQAQRMHQDNLLQVPQININWLQNKPVWNTAENILKTIYLPENKLYRNAEITNIALHLLASAKNIHWPYEIDDIDKNYLSLIQELIEKISVEYELPNIINDKILWDGLLTLVIPTCLRAEFDLWSPVSLQENMLSPDEYAKEHQIAYKLSQHIYAKTNVLFNAHDMNDLMFLVRAAYIRERPQPKREVLVVCASGMATAQLLVARLRTRFPNFGMLTVVSMRQLTKEKMDDADVIITTVPLENKQTATKIIDVHPLLLPEDMAAITQWMS